MRTASARARIEAEGVHGNGAKSRTRHEKQIRCLAEWIPLGKRRGDSGPRPALIAQPRPPTPPDPRRARKPTSGAVVPLNRVRTGGGRGASVPRPPGAGVPGWFGPGRRLGPPVALRQPSVRLGGRRGAYDEPPDGIIITARRMTSSGSHSVAPAASRSSYMGTNCLAVRCAIASAFPAM